MPALRLTARDTILKGHSVGGMDVSLRQQESLGAAILGIVSHHIIMLGPGSEGASSDTERMVVGCPKTTLHLNQGEGFQQKQILSISWEHGETTGAPANVPHCCGLKKFLSPKSESSP